jgi:hypothetical protein
VFEDLDVKGSIILKWILDKYRSRDSSVGMATRYGLDGREFESRCGRGFRTRPDRPTFCTMGTGSFQGVNRPGRGVDYPHPSSAEVGGRVELYICSPSGP